MVRIGTRISFRAANRRFGRPAGELVPNGAPMPGDRRPEFPARLHEALIPGVTL
jgi:hypothetical protein